MKRILFVVAVIACFAMAVGAQTPPPVPPPPMPPPVPGAPSPAPGAATLQSGWYRVEQTAYGNLYPAMWLLLVNGNSISGLSYWGGDSFNTLEGTIMGASVTITRSWTADGKVFKQVFTGMISKGFISGSFKADLSAGGEGTWKLYL